MIPIDLIFTTLKEMTTLELVITAIGPVIGIFYFTVKLFGTTTEPQRG